MAEQLKRTFHGCLTCRKRKVRCHGGSPCQNCSRMNITCHSSFDTNLRIRVSTPTGQKTVDTKPVPKREPEPPRQQRVDPKPSYLPQFDPRHDAFAASFEPQFTSFSFAHPPSAYALEPPHQLSPPSSSSTGATDLDPLQFAGLWAPFDFALDPELGRDFSSRVDVGASAAPVNLVPPFDAFLPGTPFSQHNYPISDSEGSTSSNGKIREGPKEWIPRRRKRTRKEAPKEAPRNNKSAAASTTSSAGAGAGAVQHQRDEVELFSHFRNCTQDDFTEQDAKWSFNRFVPDFVQKCSPHCPMRLAVLAWTAKHSAAPEKEAVAATRHSQSSDYVEKLLVMPDPTVQLGTVLPVINVAEIIISTSFFLNRYNVLCGDLKTASSRLERMTSWLAKHTGNLNLSGFASKLLLWACYLQIRISIFSADYPRFPTLLDVLTGRGDYHLIIERSHNFYLDMFGSAYPQERLAEDFERIPAALHLHETFRLLTSILRYRSLRQSQTTAAQDLNSWEELAAVKHTVDNEMQRVEADFDLAVAINPSACILRYGPMPSMTIPAPAQRNSIGASPAPPDSTPAAPTATVGGVDDGLMPAPSQPTPPYTSAGKLSRVSLHWLTAYAAFMTTKILWSRLVRLDVRTDEASTAAVESILQVALLLRRSEGEKLHARELPSMLWPLPLFVAGIETVDEVWADWVRLFISGVEGGRGVEEGVGQGGGKMEMIELLEEIRKRQDVVGTRITVSTLMAEKGVTTGMFVF
ncbi:hypothetical protein B0T25DRAFT_514833 [Lasiosphaeria hispida]|uniref:Zn(2)-C6 fungal-type domain-containing protein n=1 Tax=Lasiosphaeria hispida TaxID=260671 RepID=A0AAJ0HQA0_9PEZI|nr:hypothetical protein B0T25DRAFT_514833 [Lasiosphaeria hispida]